MKRNKGFPGGPAPLPLSLLITLILLLVLVLGMIYYGLLATPARAQVYPLTDTAISCRKLSEGG